MRREPRYVVPLGARSLRFKELMRRLQQPTDYNRRFFKNKTLHDQFPAQATR